MSFKSAISPQVIKSTSHKSYPHQQADQKELKELDRRLATAVVACLGEIANRQEEIIKKYVADNNVAHLAEGVWYPHDYIKYLRMNDSNKSAKERYQWLRQRRHLSHGYLNHKQFDPLVDTSPNGRSKRRPWHFTIRKECLPSEALKTAIKGLSILDCGATIQIARHKALLDVLGEEKFNRLFKEIMNIGYDDDERQPMRFFVDFTKSAKEAIKGKAGALGNRKIQVGNVVSFNGVLDYQQKHCGGMGANFNLVCADATPGKQLFVGHGLPSKGATEREINLMMVKEYNLPPDVEISRACDEDRKVEEFAMSLTALFANDTKPIDHQPEKYVGGFDHGSPQAFNVSLVYDLVKWPIDQISMQMVESHPCATKKHAVDLAQFLRGMQF